jgi:hypothetical protein
MRELPVRLCGLTAEAGRAGLEWEYGPAVNS